MTGLRSTARNGRRTALAARGLLVACLLGATAPGLGQQQGVTPPKDTIFARKVLMGSIEMNMAELEAMTAEGATLKLSEAREHADIVSVMLMAFPHLFPISTNEWTENADRDPAVDTYASPELWTNFPDFYKRAEAASKIAFDASNSRRADVFKAHLAELREACNSCHAAYLKTD
jgi:cytochrome c556